MLRPRSGGRGGVPHCSLGARRRSLESLPAAATGVTGVGLQPRALRPRPLTYVQVQLVAPLAALDLVVDRLQRLFRRSALRELVRWLQHAHRRLTLRRAGALLHDRGQRAQQLFRGRRSEFAEPRVAAVGARQQLGLPQQAVVLDERGESGLVALAVVGVDDVVVARGDAPQAHDLSHRVDVLGARLHALEAVGAVEQPLGILREVVQALELPIVARVADEAVGLGECRRADEARVDLHRQAVRHAGAALDAGHRLRDVDHRLARNDVLALGDRLLGQQPRGDVRRIFFQCTASMSTIRSLSTGMLPIGSIWITPPCAPRLAASRCVWQASAGSPLTRTPHEPQIAWRQEQRMPIDPSKRSRACRIASSTERCGWSSIVCSSQ